MNVVILGMRNAFRNKTRTIAIIAILGLSIGLSLVMLISYQAVQQKISDAKQSLGNTITIRPPGYTGMMGGNSSTLSGEQLNGVGEIAHVKDVVQVLSDRLNTEGAQQPMGGDSAETTLVSPVEIKKSTNSDGMTTYSGGGMMIAGSLPENFKPPIQVAGTSNTTNPNTLPGGASFSVTDGAAIGANDANEVMISESMARKNSLAVGDTFTAYGVTMTVKALFTAETEGGNNTVIMSLAALQRLTDREGQVSMAVATADSLDNLKVASESVKAKLGDDADVTSALEQLDKALQPLASVKKVALFSLLGSVVAGGAVIFMMMIMIVRERRREIGILKAIGGSNTRIVLQFMVEAVTLTCIGAVIGLIVGVMAGHPVTASLVDSSIGDTSPGAMMRPPSIISLDELRNVQAQINLSVVLIGFGGALLIAMISSSFAGWLIAKVRPSEVMRQE